MLRNLFRKPALLTLLVTVLMGLCAGSWAVFTYAYPPPTNPSSDLAKTTQPLPPPPAKEQRVINGDCNGQTQDKGGDVNINCSLNVHKMTLSGKLHVFKYDDDLIDWNAKSMKRFSDFIWAHRNNVIQLFSSIINRNSDEKPLGNYEHGCYDEISDEEGGSKYRTLFKPNDEKLPYGGGEEIIIYTNSIDEGANGAYSHCFINGYYFFQNVHGMHQGVIQSKLIEIPSAELFGHSEIVLHEPATILTKPSKPIRRKKSS